MMAGMAGLSGFELDFGTGFGAGAMGDFADAAFCWVAAGFAGAFGPASDFFAAGFFAGAAGAFAFEGLAGLRAAMDRFATDLS
jgi:hypothetical protein